MHESLDWGKFESRVLLGGAGVCGSPPQGIGGQGARPGGGAGQLIGNKKEIEKYV